MKISLGLRITNLIVICFAAIGFFSFVTSMFVLPLEMKEIFRAPFLTGLFTVIGLFVMTIGVSKGNITAIRWAPWVTAILLLGPGLSVIFTGKAKWYNLAEILLLIFYIWFSAEQLKVIRKQSKEEKQ